MQHARRTFSLSAVNASPGLARSPHSRHSATASEAFTRWCSPASPSSTSAPPEPYRSSGGGALSGAPTRAAVLSSTSCASGSCGAVKHGTPRFMIPAFSPAINARVSPRISMWSYPRVEMPHTAGLGAAFVASRRPPRPTSRIATSTWRWGGERTVEGVREEGRGPWAGGVGEGGERGSDGARLLQREDAESDEREEVEVGRVSQALAFRQAVGLLWGRGKESGRRLLGPARQGKQQESAGAGGLNVAPEHDLAGRRVSYGWRPARLQALIAVPERLGKQLLGNEGAGGAGRGGRQHGQAAGARGGTAADGGAPFDAYTFSDVDEVWGREEARPVAGGAQDAVAERTGGALRGGRRGQADTRTPLAEANTNTRLSLCSSHVNHRKLVKDVGEAHTLREHDILSGTPPAHRWQALLSSESASHLEPQWHLAEGSLRIRPLGPVVAVYQSRQALHSRLVALRPLCRHSFRPSKPS